MQKIAWFYWNPDPEIFRLPYLDHPLRWYGLFFVLGFIVGYFLIFSIFKELLNQEKRLNASDLALGLADRLTWFVVGGTIIGSRLGHVFFYEWPRYRSHPIDIFKIWEGGLASHGGAIGILLGLFLFRQLIKKEFPNLTFLKLLDALCLPTAFAAGCIRIGNFFNQEILGTETSYPWGIVFGRPADGGAVVPRHPVQLYEALAYFVTFIILMIVWKKYRKKLPTGLMTGLFFVLAFGSRFFIEFLKLPTSLMIDESWIQTGQLLSLPFILVGGILLFYHYQKHRERNNS